MQTKLTASLLKMCLEQSSKMINRASIFHKDLTFESTSRQKAQMAGDGWRAAGSQNTRVHTSTTHQGLWHTVMSLGAGGVPRVMMPLKRFLCNCKGLHLRKIFFQMMGWYILSVGTVKINLARRFLYHAFSSEHKFIKKFNLMGTSLEKNSQIMCMFHWRWKEKEGWYFG